MSMEVKIPLNNKKVQLKLFKFKHINELHWQKDSLNNNIRFLESFILTPGLNAIEKFISLLLLRSECIDSSISIQKNKRSAKADIEYILQSFSELKDIRTVVVHENFEFTFDYPSRLCVDSDTMFSVLRQIKLDDTVVELDFVPDKDFKQIISNLPPSCFSVITSFIDKNAECFSFPLLPGRSNNEIDFTDRTASLFINNLFDCISESTYREYLFLLSKRFSDINFLLNCTFYEIEDYISLYRKECQEQASELQKSIA